MMLDKIKGFVDSSIQSDGDRSLDRLIAEFLFDVTADREDDLCYWSPCPFGGNCHFSKGLSRWVEYWLRENKWGFTITVAGGYTIVDIYRDAKRFQATHWELGIAFCQAALRVAMHQKEQSSS